MFINQKSFIVHNTVIFTGWVKKKFKKWQLQDIWKYTEWQFQNRELTQFFF